ncbi:phage portal protein [Niallia circulans]|uniref:phage portal protein n=1 Tax=Niallia circulans TaxID=1397 RepID=UPI0024C3397A|nr:phage portal protein [Niallia circulans]
MAFWNRKKKKRSLTDESLAKSITLGFGDVETVGYTKLSDNPDVLIAVDKIADLVSNMTIHLMENTEEGDKRVRNQLSRKIDIEPYRNMTRKGWIYKIVRDLLLFGDGNSVVHIGVDPETTFISDLTPFQMPAVSFEDTNEGYLINYNGKVYTPDEVLHFAINPDPNYPYKGTGYRVPFKGNRKELKSSNGHKK